MKAVKTVLLYIFFLYKTIKTVFWLYFFFIIFITGLEPMKSSLVLADLWRFLFAVRKRPHNLSIPHPACPPPLSPQALFFFFFLPFPRFPSKASPTIFPSFGFSLPNRFGRRRCGILNGTPRNLRFVQILLLFPSPS